MQNLDDLIVALADLYLDTDVRSTLPRLAQLIAAAELPEDELRSLWRSQVTPLVHWNLKTVAGEWSGFDRRWLLDETQRRAGRRGLESWPLLGKLVHHFRAHGAEREFQFACELARRLSDLPEPERPRMTGLWLALMHVYYAVEEGGPSDGPNLRSPQQEIAHGAARQLLAQYGLTAHELVEEFRMICDLLAELLSSREQKVRAETHTAAWLERRRLDAEGVHQDADSVTCQHSR